MLMPWPAPPRSAEQDLALARPLWYDPSCTRATATESRRTDEEENEPRILGGLPDDHPRQAIQYECSLRAERVGRNGAGTARPPQAHPNRHHQRGRGGKAG